MKALYPFLVLILAICSLAPVPSPIVAAPPNVAIHGINQALNYQEISNRTNVMATNFTLVQKSTTTNFTMNAGSLLSLLENSFNTNFPAGCRLLLVNEGSPFYAFIVSDSTGTNWGFDPGPVLTTRDLTTGSVYSGTKTQTVAISSDVVVGGKEAETYTAALSFNYDDSALTNTADGTHTKFTWTGLIHNKSSENITNSFLEENLSIEVIGGGSIRGQSSAVFTGTIGAKMSGVFN